MLLRRRLDTARYQVSSAEPLHLSPISIHDGARSRGWPAAGTPAAPCTALSCGHGHVQGRNGLRGSIALSHHRSSVSCAALDDKSVPSHDRSTSSTGLLEAELSSMPESELADTLWAFVMTHGYDPAVCASVASVVLGDTGRFQPSSLIAILSAFAHVGHMDRDFTVTVSQHLAAPYQLAEVDTGTLAQAAWVTALLSNQGAVSFEKEEAVQNMLIAVLRQAQRRVSDFAPDDLARVLAAAGELQAPPPAALVQAASARLLNTLIPLAQLEPASLAQVVWAYTRLGLYDQAVFDAAQTELQRKADQLGWQGLAHAAWAYATVREQDAKHRAVHDVNMLSTLAAQATRQLQAALAPSNPSATPAANSPIDDLTGPDAAAALMHQASIAQSVTGPAAAAAAAGNGQEPAASGHGSNSQGTGAATASHGADSNEPPHVHRAHLMTLLLAYANLSHHDSELFTWAAKWLAGAMKNCSAQDMVVSAYVYARVKHSSPELMLALASAVPQVVDQFDADDLVYLASLGPATGCHNERLMKTVLQKAVTMSQEGRDSNSSNLHVKGIASAADISASVLLDLARCCASASGHDPEYYERVQLQLLRAVNAAQVAADMDDMSTHCGSTNPLGLQK